MARVKAFNEAEVLDKALTIFWHKGYNATSAQDLVEGLGISRSSLYDTYGDKRTLFIESLKIYEGKYTKAVTDLAAAEGNALKQLTTLFNALVQEGITDDLSKGCFMVNTAIELAPHDAEIAALVSNNMQLAEDAFYTIVKKGQEAGQIPATLNTRAIARFLFNNVTGLRVALRVGKNKKVLDDIVKTVLSVLH